MIQMVISLKCVSAFPLELKLTFHVKILGYLRIYGNESLAWWRHLLRKTVEAVPGVDSDGSILLMGDFKGGQGVLNVFERDAIMSRGSYARSTESKI